MTALGTSLMLLPNEAWAHEAWLLTPLQMLGLFDAPLAWIWQDVTALSLLIGSALLMGMIGAEIIDRRLHPLKHRLDAKAPRQVGNWALIALRLGLGLLMVMAALGLSPRLGTPSLTEPTLFVSNLELSAATSLVLPIAGLELVIGVALLFGLYVGLAAFLAMILVILGFFLFGPQIMLSYSGHLLAPALVLMLAHRADFERLPRIVRQSSLWRWQSRVDLPSTSFLLRIPAGLNFMYLATVDKYLNSPFLEKIIDDHDMPTFGMAPEVLVFVMFAVELAGGLALVLGIVERFVALVFISAMLVFAVLLGESPLIHANILGILIALLLLPPATPQADAAGAGRHPHARAKPLRLLPTGLRWATAASVCGMIAFSGLWVHDLRAAVPAADVRLVYAEGPADRVPILQTVTLEPLGEGFFHVTVKADNFQFTAAPSPFASVPFQGHAHIYVDDQKLLTLYTAEAIIGPLPEDATDIIVSLMNPNHCFVATEQGMQTMLIDLRPTMIANAQRATATRDQQG